MTHQRFHPDSFVQHMIELPDASQHTEHWESKIFEVSSLIDRIEPHETKEISIVVLVVQSLSRVQLFVTLWTAACQASLSITSSQSLLKLMSIESVMPSNYLVLRHPLLLPSIFPSIRIFFQ